MQITRKIVTMAMLPSEEDFSENKEENILFANTPAGNRINNKVHSESRCGTGGWIDNPTTYIGQHHFWVVAKSPDATHETLVAKAAESVIPSLCHLSESDAAKQLPPPIMDEIAQYLL